MPTFAPPYNPRARYLSALGLTPNMMPGGRYWWMNRATNPRTLSLGAPPAARPGAFHVPASRAAIVARAGMSRRKRLALGQEEFDQSAATLAPSPSDILAAGAVTNATVNPILSPSFGAQNYPLAPAPNIGPYAGGPLTPPALPSGTYGSVVAPGTSVSISPSGAMVANVPTPSGASWFSQASVGGLSNGTILIGLGGIALLAVMASRGRR